MHLRSIWFHEERWWEDKLGLFYQFQRETGEQDSNRWIARGQCHRLMWWIMETCNGELYVRYMHIQMDLCLILWVTVTFYDSKGRSLHNNVVQTIHVIIQQTCIIVMLYLITYCCTNSCMYGCILHIVRLACWVFFFDRGRTPIHDFVIWCDWRYTVTSHETSAYASPVRK